MTHPVPSPEETAQLLRERLDAATLLLDRTPPDATRMRALGQRRRHRRLLAGTTTAMIAAAGMTVLIVTMAASTTHDARRPVTVKPTVTPVTITVPWTGRIYAPPAKVPITRPDPSLKPSSTPCVEGDLQLTGSVVESKLPGGAAAVAIRVIAHNRSAQACEMPYGVPVRIVTPNGEVLRNGGGSTLVAHGPQPALLSGDSATTTVTWLSWCGSPLREWSFELSLNETTYQFIPVPLADTHAPPSCQYKQSAITGGQWVVLNHYGQPRALPQHALQAEIEQPSLTSRAGGTFHFSVLVTNPTQGPIAISHRPCPHYVTGLNPDSHPGIESLAGQIYYLNCSALPERLDPGQSMRLLMRMRVPKADDLFGPNKAGPYEFDWSVPDWGVATPHVPLTLR